MAKSDLYSNSMLPVVLVAGILTGGLWRSVPPADANKSEDPASGIERTDVALPPGPWVSELRPAMDSIGAALGAGPTDFDATILRHASGVALQPKGEPRDGQVLTAMTDLRASLDGEGVTCPGASPGLEQAAMVIGASFLADDGNKRKTRTDLAAALIAEYRDWRSLMNLVKAGDGLTSAAGVRYDVRFIVATVPDYVDSNSGWLADQSLAAIQSGMTSAGYLFDRIKLIDWSRGAGGVSAARGSRLHERQPGAMIFRRVEGSTVHLQIVLLVLETPTAGVHQTALRNSLAFVRAWHACSGTRRASLRVLGPTFSGSTVSLATVLGEVKDDFTERLVISGSANADENVERMAQFSSGASYRATVQPSSRLMTGMAEFLGSMNADWENGRRVALLTESNTAYGASQTRQTTGGSSFRDAAYFSFPLHVAQLRSDAPALSQPGAALLPSAIVPLNMREPSPPTDLIPALRPQLTSPVVEATVDSILDTIRHEKYTAVGIIATDNRDVLFLAREVKRAAPDVQLFFFAAHSLYLYPDYVPYLRGALVASSYSLSLANQPEIGDQSTRRSREPFQSMSAEGTFYATRALLSDRHEHPSVLGADDPTFASYCGTIEPEWPPPPPPPPSALTCVPVAPVSISVIGDDGYWTLPAAVVTPQSSTPSSNLSAGVTQAAVNTRLPPATPLNTYPLPPVPDRIMIGALLVALFVLVHVVALYVIRHGSNKGSPESSVLELPFFRVLAPPATVSVAGYHRLAVTVSFMLLALVAAWVAALVIPFASPSALVASLVVLGPASIFGGVIVAGDSLYASVHPDPDEGSEPVPSSPKRQARVCAITWKTLLIGTFGTMFLLGWVTVVLINNGAAGLARSVVLARIAGGGIVSPAALTMSLVAAIYTVLFTGMRRLSLVGLGYQRLSARSPAFAFLTGGTARTARLARILDMPAQNLPAAYSIAVLIALALACPGAWSISTIDGRVFSWFVRVGSLTALGLALLLIAQALATWSAARSPLDGLARSPLEPRFKDIAAHVPWDISLAPPRSAELLPVARLADSVMHEFRTSAMSALDPFDAKRLRRNPGDFWRFRQDAESRIGVRDEDMAELKPLFAAPSHVENLEDEGRTRRQAALIQSTSFFELWRLADAIVSLLEKTHWPRATVERASHAAVAESAKAVGGTRAHVVPRVASDVTARDGWFARCEQFVALQIAFVLRDVAARTITFLFAAMLCLTFLTASHLFYSFNGRAAMLTIDLVAVAAAALSAVWILIDMERNHVLSLLRSTTPGRVDINWDFIKRIAIYGVLPLLAVIAALFPEVGGALFGWLEPLRRLSSF